MRYCVITAMRDVEEYVPLFTRMVDSFDVQPELIFIGENDSDDRTPALLQDWKRGGLKFFSFRTGRPLLPREASARRSAHLALVRNRVIEFALTFDNWDVALMQDAQKYSPPTLPRMLIEDGGDIVAPMIWKDAEHKQFYDTWCYRRSDGTSFTAERNDFPTESTRAQVHAIGGVYLVKREVFERGCRLAGTDGTDCDSVPLCTAARAHGYRVWVRRDLNAYACETYDRWLSVAHLRNLRESR